MFMQGVNASRLDCDWTSQTTSEGRLACVVFRANVGVNLLALGLLQHTVVSVTGGQHRPHLHFAF